MGKVTGVVQLVAQVLPIILDAVDSNLAPRPKGLSTPGDQQMTELIGVVLKTMVATQAMMAHQQGPLGLTPRPTQTMDLAVGGGAPIINVYCNGRNVAASAATGLGSIPKVIPTDLNQIDHLSQDLRQIEQEVDKVAKARRIEDEQGQTIKVIDRVVLFVHGFNNSQGVVDNGQKDIDEHYGTNEVVTCAFNWKSAESVVKYWTDQETVRTCVSLFRHFVKCLGDQFSDIHIVAHSMGNYLLCETILDQDTQLTIFKNCKITCFAADVEISMYKEAIRKVLPTRIVASWNHWYNPTDGA